MNFAATWDNAANELRLPSAMGIAEKPTTTRLRPHRRAQAEDAARARGWSLSHFIEWCVDQVLGLEFLEPLNRDFVVELRQEIGHPFTDFDVINQVVTRVRLLVREGKLRPSIRPLQGRTLSLLDGR